jgi:hypothetical protein
MNKRYVTREAGFGYSAFGVYDTQSRDSNGGYICLGCYDTREQADKIRDRANAEDYATWNK